MKDIKNYKLSQIDDALARLGRAVSRLESATANAPAAADNSALEEKLENLNRRHGALKATADRVAERLDAAIGRLSMALKE